MKFFGKEVPADKIVFITNCISFVVSVIFYLKMFYKVNDNSPVPFMFNSERDSMIAIQTRVNIQLGEIKKVHDSIIKSIRHDQLLLSNQKPTLSKKRESLYVTINSDWNDLGKKEQDDYIKKVLVNLK